MIKLALPQPIMHWSTDEVEPGHRCASVIEALGKAIVPIGMDIKNPSSFAFHMSSVELDDGCVLMHQLGTPHRTFRQHRELVRSEDHSYHFMINLRSELLVDHCGRNRIRPGEGILVDSVRELELRLPQRFEVIHIKMTEAWLRRWLIPDESLIGHRFSASEGLDRTLTAFVAQMKPYSLASAALGPNMLADQFGALLMSCHGERNDTLRRERSQNPDAYDQILACMKLNCADASLTSTALGVELGMTGQQIDKVLILRGQTFAGALASMRKEALKRMMHAPAFRNVPLAELYARAGFAYAPAGPSSIVQDNPRN